MVQTQWAAGLECKVSEGGLVRGTVGQIDVAFGDDDDATAGSSDPSSGNFKQWQTELYLIVNF
jgi:hypothetical protein